MQTKAVMTIIRVLWCLRITLIMSFRRVEVRNVRLESRAASDFQKDKGRSDEVGGREERGTWRAKWASGDPLNPKIEIRDASPTALSLDELFDFVDVGLERIAHDQEVVAFAGD